MSKTYKITEKDYIKAIKKADREAEIELYGKQISMKGSIKHKNKKHYDRKRDKFRYDE